MTAPDYDVLVIGAGLAGIGFAYHLKTRCLGKSFAIMEARERLGGTWDLFRYPGIRSDVNMHLYGYEFEPWSKGACIASGDDILDYLESTAQKHGLTEHMQFGWTMVSADWRDADKLWAVEFESADASKARRTLTARWLQICTGYYSYASGHTVELPGQEDFDGPIVHPQEWPAGEGYDGKNVVIIGSGATTVTLAPSLAETARHVAVLQRSPGYVFAADSRDYLGEWLERWLPARLSFSIIRKKNLLLDRLRWWLITNKPDKMMVKIQEGMDLWLPKDIDARAHFEPSYAPHEQRICFSPDGDYFQAISDGRISVHTDTVKKISRNGIETASGELLTADVIVTATGLNMQLAGDAKLAVNGEPVTFSETMMYRGNMFAGIPNCSLTIGTFVAPYTLRVEMIAKWVCGLLNRMDCQGAVEVVAQKDEEQMNVARDFAGDFSSGYIRRAAASFPKQGTREPWLNVQSYGDNLAMLKPNYDDGILQIGRAD